MHHFGSTRTRIGRRHALIAPDGHMSDDVPGWHGGRVTVLLSPRLGSTPAPNFVQLLAHLPAGAGAAPPPAGIERFVFVLGGHLRVACDGARHELGAESFAFLPADAPARLEAASATRLLAFERRYHPIDGAAAPEPVVGEVVSVPERPFLDLAGVHTRSLLPDEPAYDLSMTVMRYRPGAALPMVETHEAEHGSLQLSGSGILRLEDAWYPVGPGDAVWMGPFCPQWFAAVGEEDATYLLYKDGRRGKLDP